MPATPTAPASTGSLPPDKLSFARRHFEAGEQAFRDRKYDVALDEFTTAYEISKEPDLLYNLHKVALKLGQKDMALSYLREYRTHRPAADQPAIDREIAEVTAADVKPEPAEVTPPPPPPAPPPAPLPPPPSELVRPPRSAGLALISVGAAFAVGGAALLAVGATTTPDGGAGTTHGRGLLVSGGFLAGTGVVAILGGVVITLKSRSAK